MLKSSKLFVFCSLLATAPLLWANDENVVDIEMYQTTPDEIAMLAVVMESCPKLIKVNDDYHNNMKIIVESHLPEAKNALAELKIRANSEEYRKLMADSRKAFNDMGDASNRELCESIRDYNGE